MGSPDQLQYIVEIHFIRTFCKYVRSVAIINKRVTMHCFMKKPCIKRLYGNKGLFSIQGIEVKNMSTSLEE